MRLLERPIWLKGILLEFLLGVTLLFVVILFNLAAGIESDQALLLRNDIAT